MRDVLLCISRGRLWDGSKPPVSHTEPPSPTWLLIEPCHEKVTDNGPEININNVRSMRGGVWRNVLCVRACGFNSRKSFSESLGISPAPSFTLTRCRCDALRNITAQKVQWLKREPEKKILRLFFIAVSSSLRRQSFRSSGLFSKSYG